MLTSRDMAVRFRHQQSVGSTREALKKGRLRELTIIETHGMLVVQGRAQAVPVARQVVH